MARWIMAKQLTSIKNVQFYEAVTSILKMIFSIKQDVKFISFFPSPCLLLILFFLILKCV
jgi:hypothetical protein